ncbi:MAG: electron transfer flavoprotein subunit beta/FixA family protein [Candidatus Methanospirareceae archaeon]
MMHIIVCIKQVPNPKYLSEAIIDEETGRLKREKVPTIINPIDENAIEEALRIKENIDGKAKISVISMGPPQAKSALKKALAMGADEAFLLCDVAFSGADTLATAYTLAKGIEKIGKFDMILCGNETIDSGTGQVPPQIAEFLNVPHVTYVREIEEIKRGGDGIGKVRVKREIEGGYIRIEVELPAVLAVSKTINTPRYPSAIGIMEAVKKEIKIWNASDIGVEQDKIGYKGSPTRMKEFFKLERRRKRKILKGEGAVKEAISMLKELGVLKI